MKKVQSDNYKFYKQVLVLGAPVMLQNLIQALVNLLDVFMIGQLGETEITAVSIGTGWINLVFLLFNGITATGGVFVAQYWGKRDMKSIHSYMGLVMVFNLVSAILFALLTVAGADWIMTFYSKDPKVISLGSDYLRIMSISSVLIGLINVCTVALTNTEQTVLPMASTVLSLLTNLVLNYVFIFGHFGVPAMGVKGAAYATVTALAVQVVFLYGRTWYKKYPICASLRAYLNISREQIKKYFQYGSFLILGEVMFAIGNNIFSMAYKYTGTSGQAALQIINTFQQLSMILSLGLGTAAGIMLGKLLGENKLELVKIYSKRFMVLIPAVAGVLGFIVYCFSPLLLGMFNINSQTMDYARTMMVIFAVTLPLKAENYAIIAGILRSGGDSWYCFLSNFVGVWIVGIPMIFLGAVGLQLTVPWVYLMANANELAKLIVGLPRTLSYKWVKNIT